MKRFKLRDQIIIKYLAADFIIISFIGFILFYLLDNYYAVTVSLWLLILSAPVAFLVSLFFSIKLDEKLSNLNKAIKSLAEGRYILDIEKQPLADEFDQTLENLNFSAKKIASREEKALNEIKRYKQVLDNLNNGVLLVSSNGEIIFANKTIENIFNVSDWHGKEVIEVFQIHDLAIHAEKSMLGKISSGKININYPKQKTLKIKSFPIEDIDSIVKGCFVLIEDSTALDRLEDVKKDLIANVSHELRTPIASIKLLTDALVASKLENKEIGHKFLNDIQFETERLSLLVNDVLNLSKLEDKDKLNKSEISLPSLLKEVENSYKTKCLEKEIALNINIQNGLPLIKADKDQLYKAFSNLLDNAVKFSQKGGRVTVEATSNNESVSISFLDEGEGIKHKDLDRIFERFYTGSKNRSDYLGTGLGLSIVKHAIEKHHGNIKVSSNWGEGSKFTVILPYKQNGS